MKKIVIITTLLFVAVSNVIAQQQNDIEYKTITLKSDNINEIFSSKPTNIRLVEGEDSHIEISYPAVEEEYLNFGVIRNNTLMIGGNGDNEAPKNSVLSETTPIYVKVSSSKLCSIANTDDMVLYVDKDLFARNLTITNSLTLGVMAESITANTKIEIVNAGTMTCSVKEWKTNNLVIANTGALFLSGTTSARSVNHTNAGIDNVDLAVSCNKLELASMGEGVIQYRGTADNLDITVLGKASVRTSELNVE